MDKIENNKAWFLVLPVFVIVAISAIIPLMMLAQEQERNWEFVPA